MACFKDGSPGVYVASKDIITSLEKVKEKYLLPQAGGLWSEEVNKAFENLKPHIINCLQLPEGFKPTIADRAGKIVLKRGTNTIESVWRCVYFVCTSKYFLTCHRFFVCTHHEYLLVFARV
jgi:hypothetical protein